METNFGTFNNKGTLTPNGGAFVAKPAYRNSKNNKHRCSGKYNSPFYAGINGNKYCGK